MKSTKDKELFAKYLLCESEKNNVQLLIAGFCRKFSTLVSECALPTDKVNKKAAISMSSMKCWGIFKSERSLEGLIINRTFPGWTGHKKSKLWLHVFRENALLLYYYFRGFGD